MKITNCRGERVNGGHLREMQDKTKRKHKAENLYKLAFILKGTKKLKITMTSDPIVVGRRH
jgi:hypothetical protein